MHALLEEGMRSGEVAPLPWTVFARGKTQDAFRYLASGAPHARGPALLFQRRTCVHAAG
jgi:hypothetical protein